MNFKQIVYSALIAVSFNVYANPPSYAPGVILVEYNENANRAQIHQSILAQKVEEVSPLAKNLEKIHIPSNKTIEEMIEILSKNPNVKYAEPDFFVTKDATPNDTYYTGSNLWGMYGDQTSPANQYGSQAGEAWAQGYTGSKDVYVGIIDSGIDNNHPELKANVWVNPYEIPNDGIDNDGNGYIDDIHGWNFVNKNNNIFISSAEDDHGTHIAGTIGAVSNNWGVVGVNWNVTMISLKFFGPNGGYTSDAIRAIDYLNDLKTRHNLNIVASNNSWGGSGYSQAMVDAINRSGDKGILFVAAAGNYTTNTDLSPFYPAAAQCTTTQRIDDCVISVAAIESTGSIAYFSNYGSTTVDLGAPGSWILSTYPSNGYATYSGTSMAAPHVTGAIALCKSINPNITPNEIKNAILSTTTLTGSLNGKTVTNGRLNIGNMVAACITPSNASVPSEPTLTKPNAPSYIIANLNVRTVTLQWDDQSNNETGFDIGRSKYNTSKKIWSAVSVIGSVGTNVTSHVISERAGTYKYYVRSKNSIGTSSWVGPSSTLIVK